MLHLDKIWSIEIGVPRVLALLLENRFLKLTPWRKALCTIYVEIIMLESRLLHLDKTWSLEIG